MSDNRSIYLEIYEREDPRLGRLVEHDSRSKSYALPKGEIKSAVHRRFAPIFNQGSIGSCTTNAGLGALASGAFYNVTKTNHPTLAFDDATALELYKAVTRIDEFRGEYPPTDTGSSGNAVGKLFKQRGYISGWLHALSLEAALTELSQRPVITGIPWYDSFNKVGTDGFIRRKSGDRMIGGHEIVVDEIDARQEWVGCTNSWGGRWGQNGRFKITFDLWRRLLEQRGDVTAFVPLTEPEPQPTPTPVVKTDDQLLAESMRKWLEIKNL